MIRHSSLLLTRMFSIDDDEDEDDDGAENVNQILQRFALLS